MAGRRPLKKRNEISHLDLKRRATLKGTGKYSNDAWSKKTTVKTYSKSRPSQTKFTSSEKFDDVFTAANDIQKGERKALKEMTQNTEAPSERVFCTSVSKISQAKGAVGGNAVLQVEHPFQIISTKTVDEDTEISQEIDSEVNRDKDNSCCQRASSPKNSTCIEGGVMIENQNIQELPLSPIQDLRVNKTNMDNISMEITNPCLSVPKVNLSCCLSTVGSSTPYILAALRVKKARKSRKASIAPFIKQRLKNLRTEKLLNKFPCKPTTDETAEKEIEEKADGQGSPIKDTSSEEKFVEGSPQITENLDQETTPEDRNTSARLNKDPASMKSRRSLSYAKRSNIPIDFLLTAPVNLHFKQVKVRIKRDSGWFTRNTNRERYAVDILLR